MLYYVLSHIIQNMTPILGQASFEYITGCDSTYTIILRQGSRAHRGPHGNIYIYIYMCVCVCVHMAWKFGMRTRPSSPHPHPTCKLSLLLFHPCSLRAIYYIYIQYDYISQYHDKVWSMLKLLGKGKQKRDIASIHLSAGFTHSNNRDDNIWMVCLL